MGVDAQCWACLRGSTAVRLLSPLATTSLTPGHCASLCRGGLLLFLLPGIVAELSSSLLLSGRRPTCRVVALLDRDGKVAVW